jgi:hypothetical protein
LELALLGVEEQAIAAALELDMSLDELRSWTARLREALQRIEPVEIPPVPREHLAILEPLTERELLRCVREANMDRRHHVHSRHPLEEGGARCDHYVEVLLKAAVERSDEVVGVARSAEANESTDTGAATYNLVDSARWTASKAVLEYWAHVTEGHIAPAESEEEYLRALVERVLRESA